MTKAKGKARNLGKGLESQGASEKPLDAKERLFVERFMVDHNAQDAARHAGYAESVCVTRAYDWVNKPEIKPHVHAEIQRRLGQQVAKLQAKADVSMEFVRQQWLKIAGLNVHDLLEVGADGKIVVDAKGNPKIDWTKLTPAQAAAIGEIDPSTGKVKFIAKDGVLRDLARHLGGFAKDAPQVTINLTLEQLINMSMEQPAAVGAEPAAPALEHQR